MFYFEMEPSDVQIFTDHKYRSVGRVRIAKGISLAGKGTSWNNWVTGLVILLKDEHPMEVDSAELNVETRRISC